VGVSEQLVKRRRHGMTSVLFLKKKEGIIRPSLADEAIEVLQKELVRP
jgi:hypothetical protein